MHRDQTRPVPHGARRQRRCCTQRRLANTVTAACVRAPRTAAWVGNRSGWARQGARLAGSAHVQHRRTLRAPVAPAGGPAADVVHRQRRHDRVGWRGVACEWPAGVGVQHRVPASLATERRCRCVVYQVTWLYRRCTRTYHLCTAVQSTWAPLHVPRGGGPLLARRCRPVCCCCPGFAPSTPMRRIWLAPPLLEGDRRRRRRRRRRPSPSSDAAAQLLDEALQASSRAFTPVRPSRELRAQPVLVRERIQVAVKGDPNVERAAHQPLHAPHRRTNARDGVESNGIAREPEDDRGAETRGDQACAVPAESQAERGGRSGAAQTAKAANYTEPFHRCTRGCSPPTWCSLAFAASLRGLKEDGEAGQDDAGERWALRPVQRERREHARECQAEPGRARTERGPRGIQHPLPRGHRRRRPQARVERTALLRRRDDVPRR